MPDVRFFKYHDAEASYSSPSSIQASAEQLSVGWDIAVASHGHAREFGLHSASPDKIYKVSGGMMATTLTLNGKSASFDVDPETPLLWVIRETAGLTGTKFGCGAGLCGACTVHVDGNPMRSCTVAIGDVRGASITTIEGAAGALAEAVRKAWIALDVVQCGYCQSGQIMAAIALLEKTPLPTDADIDDAMRGNICRCGTYQRIRAAIHLTARTLRG